MQTIVRRYRSSRAGRHESATRDQIFHFNDLLKESGAFQGAARYEAIQELEALENRQILVLHRAKRDTSVILEVRLPLANESAFFDYVLRSRTGRAIQSLHMFYRPTSSAVALSREDQATIGRLSTSEHLTSIEKEQLSRMGVACSKGSYEQESMGRPLSAWPFY